MGRNRRIAVGALGDILAIAARRAMRRYCKIEFAKAGGELEEAHLKFLYNAIGKTNLGLEE